MTAVFYDSLDGSVSDRLRSFCTAAFGKRWRGVIEKLPSHQQDDAHNCGVFAVMNAVHSMRSGAVQRYLTLMTGRGSGWRVRGCLARHRALIGYGKSSGRSRWLRRLG